MDQRLLLMHQVMLGDRVRLRAYDQALRHAVTGDSVVADIGAGALILSLIALRHGARRVYAIESDPETLKVAKRIIDSNRLGDRLKLISGDARTVRLPEKADVVVTEMMGNLGPEEEMPEIVERFCRRNLAPGGRIAPERIATHLQAIQFDDEGWGVWRDSLGGFSLSCVQELAPSRAHLHFFSRDPIALSPPATVSETYLGRRAGDLEQVQTLSIRYPGTMHAVIGYFTATLMPGVQLSNFPSYPGSNWAVWVWPIRHTRVAPGDKLRVALKRPENIRIVTDWELDCAIARRRSA